CLRLPGSSTLTPFPYATLSDLVHLAVGEAGGDAHPAVGTGEHVHARGTARDLHVRARVVAGSLELAGAAVGRHPPPTPVFRFREIGRAHVCTPVTCKSRMPSSA